MFDEVIAPPKIRTQRTHQNRYSLPRFNGDTGRTRCTRVTTFAKTISDTYLISLWQQRLVAQGLVRSPQLLLEASQTNDRSALNDVCDRARTLANEKIAADQGTALHLLTERYDRGESLTPQEKASIEPYVRIIQEYGLQLSPELTERIVYISQYNLGGRFDRIAYITKDTHIPGTAATLHAGEYVVVDLKTGKDLSYGWGEIAVQLALYANSTAMWVEDTDNYDPMPEPMRLDVALVVHLPIQGEVAHLYAVDIHQGMLAAELCYKVRTWRSTKDLSVLVASIDTNVIPPISDVGISITDRIDAAFPLREPTLEERILSATSQAELSRLWKIYNGKGWTDYHTQLGKDRLADFRTF